MKPLEQKDVKTIYSGSKLFTVVELSRLREAAEIYKMWFEIGNKRIEELDNETKKEVVKIILREAELKFDKVFGKALKQRIDAKDKEDAS